MRLVGRTHGVRQRGVATTVMQGQHKRGSVGQHPRPFRTPLDYGVAIAVGDIATELCSLRLHGCTPDRAAGPDRKSSGPEERRIQILR